MITKQHASAYTTLFARANEVLKAHGSTEEFRNANIQHIDDYFACLKELADIEKLSAEGKIEKIDPIFTILPATEDRFHINADKREITTTGVLSKFVGVKGDEIAEIIYFDIDRYFDAMDLADMDIIIQWKHEKDAESAGSLSAIYKKSLTLESGKIVFGWPITSEVTAKPGKIQYSVRFYRRDKDINGNDILVYSFSTLTHTITIQPALDFELSNELLSNIINRDSRIYNNLRNSDKAELTYELAKPRIVGYYLYADGALDADINANKTYNLPVTFVIKAEIPKDTPDSAYISASGLSYQWFRKDNKDASEQVVMTDAASNLYIEVEDRKESNYNPKEIYYWFNKAENRYDPYVVNGDSNPFDDKDEETGELIPLYTRHSQLTPPRAGYYYAIAAHTYKPGEDEKITFEGWTVPYAMEPVYSYPESGKVVFLPEDGSAAIFAVNATVTDGGTLTNQWFRNVFENSLDGAQEYLDAEGESITTNECSATEEGYYFLKATNNFNESQSKNYADAIEVVYEASEPVIVSHLLNGTARPSDYPINAYFGDTARVELSNPKHGQLSYQWYNDATDEPIVGEVNKSFELPNSGSYYCKITNSYKANQEKTINSQLFMVINP